MGPRSFKNTHTESHRWRELYHTHVLMSASFVPKLIWSTHRLCQAVKRVDFLPTPAAFCALDRRRQSSMGPTLRHVALLCWALPCALGLHAAAPRFARSAGAALHLRTPSPRLQSLDDSLGDDGGGLGNSPVMQAAAGKLVDAALHQEVSDSYMAYAMSVIMSRALPDVRDGLKPVHRRILYAMHELNLAPNTPHRKCARVVGEVLGKYHPHGDNSVYDALVRMAQDFSLRAPLIDGHGNFGSIDPDPAAAMRYTECRLASLAAEALLADIGEDVVDFVENFDGSETEPQVLPAKLPMLLLNGATGIAVGMATNCPPHNLGELVDALQALLDDRDVSDEALFKLIPAPDFPTGGIVMGTQGAHQMYTTGRGSVTIRAAAHVELPAQRGGGRSAVVVTELPYGVAKGVMLERIAAMVRDAHAACPRVGGMWWGGGGVGGVGERQARVE